MNSIKATMLLNLTLVISTLLNSILPVSSRSIFESFMCDTGLSGAFTIEGDVYLNEDSRGLTHNYSIKNGTLDKKLNTYLTINGNKYRFDIDKKLEEVHTIVPLSGFCLKSPLCTDRSWNELEKLVIVHGKMEKPDYEGFLLAERDVDANRKFKLLTNETISQNVLEKMRKLNLTVSNNPHYSGKSSLMSIPTKLFWESKQSTNRTGCLGAVFVPSRAEMLVLVNEFPDYPANLFQLTLLRRKFEAFGSERSKWDRFQLSDMDLDLDVKLVGLISINETVYAIGWDSELFDVVWDDRDKISVKRSVNKTKLDNNCVEKSSKLGFSRSEIGRHRKHEQRKPAVCYDDDDDDDSPEPKFSSAIERSRYYRKHPVREVPCEDEYYDHNDYYDY